MLEPEEPFSEHLTLRVRRSELRRLDAAADVAGVSRSRILREGGLEVARGILRSAAGEGEGAADRD